MRYLDISSQKQRDINNRENRALPNRRKDLCSGALFRQRPTNAVLDSPLDLVPSRARNCRVLGVPLTVDREHVVQSASAVFSVFLLAILILSFFFLLLFFAFFIVSKERI